MRFGSGPAAEFGSLVFPRIILMKIVLFLVAFSPVNLILAIDFIACTHSLRTAPTAASDCHASGAKQSRAAEHSSIEIASAREALLAMTLWQSG
jgi:hypothetical protein